MEPLQYIYYSFMISTSVQQVTFESLSIYEREADILAWYIGQNHYLLVERRMRLCKLFFFLPFLFSFLEIIEINTSISKGINSQRSSYIFYVSECRRFVLCNMHREIMQSFV